VRGVQRRIAVGPVAPAGAAFLVSAVACAAVLAADPFRGLPTVALVWVLLGVTAGYSISGSV
jgi:hypothetical protein